MPPQPPIIIHLITPLIFLLITTITTTTSHLCPPFTTTTPPYPFSTTPNSGHPSFQIKCSPPPQTATITINNLHFNILTYDPTSTTPTLTLSLPSPTTITTTNCPTTLPTQPINFSNSPFKPTDSFCSRLSYIKPCHSSSLPNCTHCPHLCKFTKTPLQLIHSCTSTHPPLPTEGCQSDILSFLDSFLKFGIEVEFETKDSYFTNCKSCKSNNGVCGFNSSNTKQPFLCFNSSNQHKPISKKPNLHMAVMSLSLLVLCFLLIILLTTYISRKRKNLSLQDPAVVYLHSQRSASLLPPVFTFEELQKSTNNFDPVHKIGDGGFGSVYVGHLQQNHQENKVFAIKFLHKQNPTSNSLSTKSFCNEILILSSLKHPNLVKLHGYCSDPRGLLLVYEYVPNGTLSDHLHVPGKKCLPWHVRLDIALQIAVAIEYLHFSVIPPVVHRDITSNNIFADKDMRVKLGDFGLSRLLDPGTVWTGPQGTPGYLDPDYYRSFRLTEKSDVYSFGVVLLELVTGMKAVDVTRDKREMTLAEMAVGKIQMGLLADVIDPRLSTVDGGAVAAVAELSFRCVAADRDDRPDAKEVVAELRRIKGRARGGSGGTVGVRVSNSNSVVVPDGGMVVLD